VLGLLLCGAGGESERFKVVAYVPNWIDLKQFSKQIDYKKLTHINIAFENPINDQGELSFHPDDALIIRSAREHHVKVLVSIGGGAVSSNKELNARYIDLLSPAKRALFAKSLADYVVEHDFDGLDVDIEGSLITDTYGPFITELTQVLKPHNKLLTAAFSQGYGGKQVPTSVFDQFDFINVMAYDAAGPWNPNEPGQHSSLAFSKRSVEYWRTRGLANSKIVLGVPFYGYGFGKAFKPAGYSYKSIVKQYPGAEKFDEIGETIWYNGIESIKTKTKSAKEDGLGGIMIWSLDNDATGEKSLLTAIDQALREE